MKNDRIDRYIIIIRCTYYNKYNVRIPVLEGSYTYDIIDEFIGDELQAAEHFNSKYNKICDAKFSMSKFQVTSVYKIIQEGAIKYGC